MSRIRKGFVFLPATVTKLAALAKSLDTTETGVIVQLVCDAYDHKIVARQPKLGVADARKERERAVRLSRPAYGPGRTYNGDGLLFHVGEDGQFAWGPGPDWDTTMEGGAEKSTLDTLTPAQFLVWRAANPAPADARYIHCRYVMYGDAREGLMVPVEPADWALWNARLDAEGYRGHRPAAPAEAVEF